jgi:hypothetical protein
MLAAEEPATDAPFFGLLWTPFKQTLCELVSWPIVPQQANCAID